jgi:hypothetical protein
MTETNSLSSKNSPGEMIESLRAIHNKYALAAIREHLNACTPMLEDGDFIDVGIFGRFKAGKSSLLNLIADKTVLPVGVTPVTAVVTRMRYGPRTHASVPSGASTGENEACELRDDDKKRYDGKCVLKAVSNVNKTIAPKVIGMDPHHQVEIDHAMIFM